MRLFKSAIMHPGCGGVWQGRPALTGSSTSPAGVHLWLLFALLDIDLHNNYIDAAGLRQKLWLSQLALISHESSQLLAVRPCRGSKM